MSTVYKLHKDDRAFSQGVIEGRAAKERQTPLTPYLRVGIDDYAQGYRSGFFTRTDNATTDGVADSQSRP